MQFFRKFKIIFFKEIPTLILEKTQASWILEFFRFNWLIRRRRHPKDLVLIARVCLEHRCWQPRLI